MVQRRTRLEENRLNSILIFMAQIRLIDLKALKQGALYLPKMKEHCDEYTRKVRSKSGDTPDNIPLEQIRTDKNRLDKNRIDQNTLNSIVSYFFELKGWANKSKEYYKKNKIVYARYVKAAKELYFLCDNDIEEAKKCLDIMAKWADSRELDWGIETIFKKWYDIDKLKPKEKKPYYEGNRVFDMAGKKYVLMPNGDKLQFAGSTSSLKYK